MERLFNTVSKLRPIVQKALQDNRERQRSQSAPNFTEGDFVLVAREDFSAGENFSLRWRGTRRIVRSVNDYVYKVEDLCDCLIEEVHATRLKFYHDQSLDVEAVMPHGLSSRTGMKVQLMMRPFESEEYLIVQVRWRDLSPSEGAEEPLHNVYKDVPDLLRKLLRRKNTRSIFPQKPIVSSISKYNTRSEKKDRHYLTLSCIVLVIRHPCIIFHWSWDYGITRTPTLPALD